MARIKRRKKQSFGGKQPRSVFGGKHPRSVFGNQLINNSSTM